MSQVVVQGKSTKWLVAPETLLSVPKSIPGGSTVGVDGQIVFKIKSSTVLPRSEPFKVQDGVDVNGFMTGIERVVPSFHSPRPILFQHPLSMDRPKFLKCVAPGQTVLIKSTVIIPESEN
jgi:hypothetical protein